MAHQQNRSTARKGAVINDLLQQDALRDANCFSLTRFDGLREGFSLTLDRPRPNGLGICQPHLQVGHEHVDRNKHPTWGCLYNGRSGLVRRAELVTVNPSTDGKKPFYVLNRIADERSNPQLLHVFFGWKNTWPLKLKADLRKKEIPCGISSTAEIVFQSGDEALIRFTEDGQDVHVMYPDGNVDRVYREDGHLVFDDTLTSADMAKVRVENAKQQLASAHDRRHRDLILWKVIDLLELTKSHEGARDILRDFLNTQELSKAMDKAFERARTNVVDLSVLGNRFRIIPSKSTGAAA